MSGIYHSWDGTVLTITSDAGTSSADLKGDDGCRGPQGPAGEVYKPVPGVDYWTETEKEELTQAAVSEANAYTDAMAAECVFIGDMESVLSQNMDFIVNSVMNAIPVYEGEVEE